VAKDVDVAAGFAIVPDSWARLVNSLSKFALSSVLTSTLIGFAVMVVLAASTVAFTAGSVSAALSNPAETTAFISSAVGCVAVPCTKELKVSAISLSAAKVVWAAGGKSNM
jgi:hypothetical protein